MILIFLFFLIHSYRYSLDWFKSRYTEFNFQFINFFLLFKNINFDGNLLVPTRILIHFSIIKVVIDFHSLQRVECQRRRNFWNFPHVTTNYEVSRKSVSCSLIFMRPKFSFQDSRMVGIAICCILLIVAIFIALIIILGNVNRNK